MTIVYDLNGGVAITTICNKMSADEYVKTYLPKNVRYFILTDSTKIPSDSIFRDAWVFAGNIILVNVDKAKKIKQNHFRQARKPILEKLDIEYMRATETADKAKTKLILAKKQELRNVTNIDLPNDISELAKFWPDVLNHA